MILSLLCGVVAPADKVVQGYVKEVGQSSKGSYVGFSRTGFVVLVGSFRYVEIFSHCFLSKTLKNPNMFQALSKKHDIQPLLTRTKRRDNLSVTRTKRRVNLKEDGGT